MPGVIESTEGRELLEQFTTSINEVREQYNKSEAERKQFGQVTSETAEKVRAAEAKADDIGRKVEEYAKKNDERLDKFENDLRLVKTRSWRPPGIGDGGGGDGRDLRTFGERFVDSNEYKNEQWSGKFRMKTAIGGRIVGSALERKAANTITSGGSGWVYFPQRVGVFSVPPLFPLVMRDLLTVIPITTNAIEYVFETWNYTADYQVNEGDKKAQGDVTYTDATANVRTIAWFVKISRQMLADNAYIAQTIDSRLVYGVLKKEEHEILYGDGAAGHLHGIMPQATTPPANVLPGVASRIDEIAAAVAHLASLGYPPTAIVLNALTWAGMSIAKNTMGGYILGGPPQAEAAPRLWGLPLVSTPEMAANDYLVGAFPGNAALFDRETAMAEISYENEDDFVRNLATIRAEERVALAVYAPQAFAKGPFKQTAVAEAGGGVAPAKK